MRVITNRRLVDFARGHPDAEMPLQSWRKVIESSDYGSFAQLRESFGSVDKVDDLHVFNIAGNKYRLIAFVHFEKQLCFIKHVLTHAEYDKGHWRPK